MRWRRQIGVIGILLLGFTRAAFGKKKSSFCSISVVYFDLSSVSFCGVMLLFIHFATLILTLKVKCNSKHFLNK